MEVFLNIFVWIAREVSDLAECRFDTDMKV